MCNNTGKKSSFCDLKRLNVCRDEGLAKLGRASWARQVARELKNAAEVIPPYFFFSSKLLHWGARRPRNRSISKRFLSSAGDWNCVKTVPFNVRVVRKGPQGIVENGKRGRLSFYSSLGNLPGAISERDAILFLFLSYFNVKHYVGATHLFRDRVPFVSLSLNKWLAWCGFSKSSTHLPQGRRFDRLVADVIGKATLCLKIKALYRKLG